jgi:hypothetical protein
LPVWALYWGLLSGFAFNLYCWLAIPQLSWLWWNVFGFIVAVAVGYGISWWKPRAATSEFHWSPARYRSFGFQTDWRFYYAGLVAAFAALLILLAVLQRL